MSAPAYISKRGCDSAPFCPVARAVPGQRVGNLMQQHLLNLRGGPLFAEIARERDAVAVMIALAKAGFCSIPAKAPGTIQTVQFQHRSGSLLHPRCFGHAHRVTKPAGRGSDFSTDTPRLARNRRK